MIQDDWNPTKEDIEWTREQVEKMQVGDTWGVADAVLRKDVDNVLTVLKASPASIMPLERIKKVCNEIGYVLIDDQAEIIHDAQAAAQEAAQEWSCTHEGCQERIVNFDLENVEWLCLDPDAEAWRVVVSHETAEGERHDVQVSPMDYNLVAGDELFFTWEGMPVLERHEIIDLADAGTLLRAIETKRVVIMPSTWNSELVPPHLRGLIFRTKPPIYIGEEE